MLKYAEKILKYVPYNEQEQKDKIAILKYIETFDNILTRDNELVHITVSNWIVNKEKTKVLMCFHNIYNSWAWTGGHADGDSDLIGVGYKEAQEETGIKNIHLLSNDIYSLEIISIPSHIKRGKYVMEHNHLNITFLFEADENDVISIKADENSGVKWIKLEDVDEACSEDQMKIVYRKLIDKLKMFNKK